MPDAGPIASVLANRRGADCSPGDLLRRRAPYKATKGEFANSLIVQVFQAELIERIHHAALARVPPGRTKNGLGAAILSGTKRESILLI